MWARLDDGIIDHEKLEAAAERLGGAHGYERVLGAVAWGIVHSTRLLTDGVLTARAVRRRGITAATIEALVAEQLWHRTDDGGFLVHDFLDWNPSGSDVKFRRSRDRDRKRKRDGFHGAVHADRPKDVQQEFRSESHAESEVDSAKSSSRAVPVPSRPVPKDQHQNPGSGGSGTAIIPANGPVPPPHDPGHGPEPDTGEPDAPRIDLALGQARTVARSVIALWNQGCNGRLPAVAHEPASLPRVVKAVQQRGWGLATWAALFDAVHASAWLTGRKPGRDGATFAADFWWVLEHLDEIRSGRYTDRATPDRPHERTVTVAEARAIFGGPS